MAPDAGPSSPAVTFGCGHSFFDRTGLRRHRPRALVPLPDFSSDRLDKARGNGELWVRIGANDALVAFDAVRITCSQRAWWFSRSWTAPVVPEAA